MICKNLAIFHTGYLVENIVEPHVLWRDWIGDFGPHAGSKLVHERQELVGWDLFHSFLICESRHAVNCKTNETNKHK